MRRIEWDERGLARRLYPFTRKHGVEESARSGRSAAGVRGARVAEPKLIVIDPRISFGRPVLAGTGIRTAIIAERYKAGESIEELARDYGRPRLEIEEAIR